MSAPDEVAQMVERLRAAYVFGSGVSMSKRRALDAAALLERLQRELTEENDELERRRWYMEQAGYRRCDIPACNCNLWHGGHAYERLDELREEIGENGRTLLDSARALRARLEAAEALLREMDTRLVHASEIAAFVQHSAGCVWQTHSGCSCGLANRIVEADDYNLKTDAKVERLRAAFLAQRPAAEEQGT